MQSESARATTRAESAFRIPYANSRPRAARVIALDPASAALVDAIARQDWNGAEFFTSLSFAAGRPPGAGHPVAAWLNDVAGRALDLADEIAHADFVVVVTAAGEDAQAVSIIAELCSEFRKSLIALVVPGDSTSDEDVALSLRHLRPHARMLVVAHGRDYIETMLTALRA